MMKKSALILASAITIMSSEAFGQSFTQTFYNQDIHHNHYSVEQAGSDYVLAGTLFDKNTNNNDIHIIRMDAYGNVIWEKVIDESNDDRALDVCIGNNGNIAVTGYITINGIQSLYAVTLQSNGTFITDTRDVLGENSASAGTNIIYSSSNQEYIVGGYHGNNSGFSANPPYVDHGYAIVIRFSSSLGLIDVADFTSTTHDYHASVNDIIEIKDSPVTDDGYFVTGTLGKPGQNNETSVLAVRLDYSLNLLYNASFESSLIDKGVSAVYNEGDQEVYVLSNNSSTRKPQFSVIDESTGSILSSYALNVFSNVQGATASAFQMIDEVSGSGNIVAAGYFDEYSIGGTTNNAAPWIIEFTPSGSIVNSYIQAVPSDNFPSHGGGILSTFINPHPYIFNQEILSSSGESYVLLNPRTVNTSYSLQVSAFSFQNASEFCFEENEIFAFPICNQSIEINTDSPKKTFQALRAKVLNYESNLSEYCGEDGSEKASNLRIKSSDKTQDNIQNLNAYPNPFNKSLTIEVKGSDLNGELEVLNSIGEVVHQTNLRGENYKTELDMEGKAEGLYFIKYRNSNKQEVVKTIKL